MFKEIVHIVVQGGIVAVHGTCLGVQVHIVVQGGIVGVQGACMGVQVHMVVVTTGSA